MNKLVWSSVWFESACNSHDGIWRHESHDHCAVDVPLPYFIMSISHFQCLQLGSLDVHPIDHPGVFPDMVPPKPVYVLRVNDGVLGLGVFYSLCSHNAGCIYSHGNDVDN